MEGPAVLPMFPLSELRRAKARLSIASNPMQGEDA
jgi:hypothetical protein